MKKIIIITLIMISMLTISGCKKEEVSVKYLDTPIVELETENSITWQSIAQATEYELNINDILYVTENSSFQLNDFGTYSIKIRSISSDPLAIKNSPWSEVFSLSFDPPESLGVIVLNTTYIELSIGDTFDLEADTYPASTKDFSYEIEDTSIVTEENGSLAAEGIGKTVVKISKELYKDAYIQVVVFPNIQNEKGNQITVEEGDLYNLDLIMTPVLSSEDIVTYESSDESIAFVGPTGVIKALEPGMVTIMINSSNGGSLTIDLVVKKLEPPVVTLEVILPEEAMEGYEVYISGSFNGWMIKDESYKLTQDENNVLRYTITLYSFEAKKEIQYKYILGSSENYAWENYMDIPMANRTLFVNGGENLVDDTIASWQELLVG